MAERKEHNKLVTYIINVMLAVDQLFNALFFGDPDETISSRLGKWLRSDDVGKFRRKLAYVICRMLHWIDKGHCEDAIEEDEGKWAVIRGKRKDESI